MHVLLLYNAIFWTTGMCSHEANNLKVYIFLFVQRLVFIRSSCLKNVIHKTSLICLKIVLLFGHQPILSGFNYKLYKDSVIYCFIEQLLFGLP